MLPSIDVLEVGLGRFFLCCRSVVRMLLLNPSIPPIRTTLLKHWRLTSLRAMGLQLNRTRFAIVEAVFTEDEQLARASQDDDRPSKSDPCGEG